MISINLRETAKKKGYTLTDIANATHISMNTLSVLGRGDSKGIQFETLDKICQFLACTPNDIFQFKNDSLDITVGTRPERIDKTLLFSGELLPISIAKQMSEGLTTSFRGHPFFIELPETSKGSTLVVKAGLTPHSVSHFFDRDTAGTSTYTLEESKKYLDSLTHTERDQLLISATTFARDRLAPEVFKDVSEAYAIWFSDPEHKGSLPMIPIDLTSA